MISADQLARCAAASTDTTRLATVRVNERNNRAPSCARPEK
jgi:hypothetical protein